MSASAYNAAIWHNTGVWQPKLTGSRFFGGAREDSDYDFFLPFSRNTHKRLYKSGFQPLDEYGKNLDTHFDSNTVQVFRANGIPVDVQLVWDFDLKILAQKYIQDTGLLFYNGIPVPKRFHRDIWELAYKIVKYRVG